MAPLALGDAEAVGVKPEVFDWVVGRVEVTTADVVGMEAVAVPSSTLK